MKNAIFSYKCVSKDTAFRVRFLDSWLFFNMMVLANPVEGMDIDQVPLGDLEWGV